MQTYQCLVTAYYHSNRLTIGFLKVRLSSCDCSTCEPHHEKTRFLQVRKQRRRSVTAQLNSAFVFPTQIVQFLFFLNLKFQASSHLLAMHICMKTCADQLCSNSIADQCLCLCSIDGMIPLLSKSEIYSFQLFSVTLQASLCWTWLDIPLGFLVSQLLSDFSH